MTPIISGYGANLLATPFILGQLGLHDFGIWSITGAIAQYAVLLDFGVSRAANRYVALFHAQGDKKGEGAVVGICVISLTALGSLLIALSVLSTDLLSRVIGTEDPKLTMHLVLCAIIIAITGLVARVFSAASVGRGRQVPSVIGIAILSTLQVGGGVAALIRNASLSSFATGTTGGALVGFFIVLVIILIDERRIVVGWPRTRLVREILKYGLSTQIAVTGDIIRLQSGKLIAGIVIGPTAAAVFDLATRLAMGAQAFGAASASALTPHLTRTYVAGGLEKIVHDFERLTQRNTAVAIITPLTLIATASCVVPLWLGNRDSQVLWILLALLPGIALNVSTAVCSSTLLALGRPAVIAQFTLTSAVLLVGLAISLGSLYGLAGIAVTFAVGEPILEVLGLWYMHRRMTIPFALYLRGSRGPYAAGLLGILIALPVGLVGDPHNRPSAAWWFFLSALAFGSVYIAVGMRCGYLPRLSVRVPCFPRSAKRRAKKQ